MASYTSSKRYSSPPRQTPGNHGVGSNGRTSASNSSAHVRSLPPTGSTAVSPQNRKGQVQNLLGEFKNLYEGKLKRLDEADRGGEETTKVSLLYVNFN